METFDTRVPGGAIVALAAMRAAFVQRRAASVYETLTADGEPDDVEAVAAFSRMVAAIEQRRTIAQPLRALLPAVAQVWALVVQS